MQVGEKYNTLFRMDIWIALTVNQLKLITHTCVPLLFSLNFSSHSLWAFSSSSYRPMSCAWCCSALSMSSSLPCPLKQCSLIFWVSLLDPNTGLSSGFFPLAYPELPLDEPGSPPKELETSLELVGFSVPSFCNSAIDLAPQIDWFQHLWFEKLALQLKEIVKRLTWFKCNIQHINKMGIKSWQNGEPKEKTKGRRII